MFFKSGFRPTHTINLIKQHKNFRKLYIGVSVINFFGKMMIVADCVITLMADQTLNKDYRFALIESTFIIAATMVMSLVPTCNCASKEKLLKEIDA